MIANQRSKMTSEWYMPLVSKIFEYQILEQIAIIFWQCVTKVPSNIKFQKKRKKYPNFFLWIFLKTKSNKNQNTKTSWLFNLMTICSQLCRQHMHFVKYSTILNYICTFILLLKKIPTYTHLFGSIRLFAFRNST